MSHNFYNILQLEASQLEYYLSTKLSSLQIQNQVVTAVASTKGSWLYESHLALFPLSIEYM